MLSEPRLTSATRSGSCDINVDRGFFMKHHLKGHYVSASQPRGCCLARQNADAVLLRGSEMQIQLSLCLWWNRVKWTKCLWWTKWNRVGCIAARQRTFVKTVKTVMSSVLKPVNCQFLCNLSTRTLYLDWEKSGCEGSVRQSQSANRLSPSPSFPLTLYSCLHCVMHVCFYKHITVLYTQNPIASNQWQRQST